MKASLHAVMVIGYEIPASEVLQDKEVRGCHHDEVEGANFCPECGKPMWVYSTEPIFLYDRKLDDFDVVVIPNEYEDKPGRYYIGHGCETNWSIPELAKYDFNKHRDALKETLEKLNIDPNKCRFGLHLGAGLSY
jgi:hypothetical protein